MESGAVNDPASEPEPVPQAVQPSDQAGAPIGRGRAAALILSELFAGTFLGLVTVTVLWCATPVGSAAWAVIAAAGVLSQFVRKPWAIFVFMASVVVVPLLALAIGDPHALLAWFREVGVLGVVVCGLMLLLCVLVLVHPPKMRRRPPAWLRPGLTAGLLLPALVVGALLGVALNKDEPPGSFPLLAAALRRPEGGQNGYPLLVRAASQYDGDAAYEAGDLRARVPAAGIAPGPEWLAQARKVVDADRELIALADRVLACDLIAGPLPQTGQQALLNIDHVGSTALWMGRLMEIEARLQLAEGRADLALRRAQDAVRLGLMLGRGSSDSVQSLTGRAIVEGGLGEVRNAACSDGATVAMLRPLIGGLEISAELKAVEARRLALDFRGTGLIVRDFLSLKITDADDGPPPDGAVLMRAFVRRIPTTKPNMALNPLGRYLEALSAGLDGPAPAARPEPPFQGYGATSVRWTNFLPDMIVESLTWPLGRSVRNHYEVLALASMTQIFTALRCCQLEHGRLPDSLDELAPEYLPAVPANPFTGRPFGYEPTGEKPRIWSVGPDQKTDAPDAKEGDDVVVPLEFAGGA